MSNESAIPAGWYADGVNGQRYWDGLTWTEHRAPQVALRPMNGASVAGFVLGIWGFLFTPIPFFIGLFVGAIPALIGVVLSIVGLAGRNERGNGLAVAGLILGALALIGILFGSGTVW